ncbi:tail fiber domain-containing protein [Aureisphaera sp. CAU 1614]|uniref:Tail fiber domain-containing protein n=1 Tax=Halomarinibacterium sedimenti TaxID=2857106 RepID=A0A9X1FQ32_9FLAO|nr:tail fiber domain-containing protein [Halomarinibacterium sedimenti]MBW2938604.1 tail fiber domain-containing protein [Halomarinibacterium sedimenti]
MKKFILFSLVTLFCHSLFSQVGIGNTDPKSTLDISATNIATPSNTDGILIPRVDDFPATNPTVDQDGMMVFATGNGTPSKGFYYWDNGSTSWVAISSGGGSDDDWYEENTTSPPTSNSADIFTDGNVGIGLSNVSYPLQIESQTAGRMISLFNESTGSSVYGIRNTIDESAASSNGSTNGISNLITRTNQGSISGVSNSFSGSVSTNSFGYLYGYQNSFGNSTSTSTFGLLNRFQGVATTASGLTNLLGNSITTFYGVDNHDITGGSLSGNFYGLYNNISDSGSGDRYGVYTILSETGSGDKYGEYIEIPTTAGGTHYGVYSDVQNGAGYAGYFLGRTSLGTGTTNRYLMPAADGTAGQVMTTDGAGNISFTTPSSGGGTLDQAYDFGGAGAGRTITADSGAVIIEGNGGLRVESTNETNMLRVDGANDAVGIGENTPVSPLQIGITTPFDLAVANSGQDGIFIKGGNSGGLNQIGGSIGFGGASTTRSDGRRAAIASIQSGADEDNIGLGFYIHNGPINTEPMVEGMRLKHNGNLGINNNDPSATLDVVGTLQFVDGNEASGFVLASDATGNATWTNPTTLITPGAQKIDDLTDGKSDSDGTDDGSSIFIGISAGAADDGTDKQNVAIGFQSFATGLGVFNTALGYEAMSNATAGNSNTAIGRQTLQNNSGGGNTALGNSALTSNTSGSSNTAIGNSALLFNTTGHGNVAVGLNAGRNISSGSDNVLIGRDTGPATSSVINDRLFIDNQSGLNPLIYGEFDNDIVRINGELQVDDPTGTGYSFPTTDGTSGQVLTTDGVGQLSFTTLTLTDTQNTLDQAYDEGGAGAGRTITADNGAVTINGQDGFMVTGGFGSGDIVSVTGIGTRMFFNPNKAAFRAGSVGSGGIYDPTAWDDANIGARSFAVNIGTIASASYSFASGVSTEASGYASTAMGYISEASGWYSTAMGEGTIATGSGEMAVGSYNKTGISRVFVVGNGTSDVNRSNAFEVFDSGVITFNEAYSFPTFDGSANQVLRTNGAGTVTWATLSGEATTASNGLSETGNDVRLGGTLSQITTIDQGNNNLRFDLTGNGGFMVLDNGTIEFIVEDSGDVGIGTNNPNYQLDVNESDNTKAIGVNIQKTDNTSTLNTAAMSVTKTASGTGSSSVITTFADGTGSGEQRGIYNILNGTGTGNKYGVKNELTSASNGLQYGMENNFSGGTSSVRYAIRNNFSAGTGTQLGMYNSFANNTSGADTGISNFFSGTNAAAKTGLSNIFAIASAGDQTGIVNSFGSTSNTNKVGGYTSFSSTTGGAMYGFQVDVTATGATNKYGIYVDFDTAVTGTNNYGVYSIVDNTDGWSGYFEGKNYVSDAIGINNPAPDGRLDIIHNSTGATSPHIMLTAQNANAGTRIVFDNAVETTNNWVLFARADDDVNGGTFNIFSSEAGTNVVRLDSDGKMGVMRNPATNTLEVEGDASKSTAGSWLANSDQRLKKEIKSISGETALDKIEKMRGVTYLWNDDKTGTKRPEGLQYGFIAQELMEVFPEKVTKDNLGFYQTAYGDYDPIFVEAIKELKDEVDTLSEENQKLKAQLSKYESLEARLSALEANNPSNNTSGITSEKKK